MRAAPDERFERRGADLWHVQEIAAPDAALGAEIRADARGRGDLYVRLAVRRPGAEARKLWESCARSAADHAIAIVCRLDFSILGSVSSSMPSFIEAFAFESSTAAGSSTVRVNAPREISQR